ncbi:N-6 DNA methylase [Leifsonia aquatica]|uniref:N-6 DNA methylase n=1 Tax=Leifsonia aquatica TaxID=144185 RepID=UPI003808728E
MLGLVYEYFLGQFASKESDRNAGSFYKPRVVVKTLVGMLEPFKGHVYDSTAGSGGMFVQSAGQVLKQAELLADSEAQR